MRTVIVGACGSSVGRLEPHGLGERRRSTAGRRCSSPLRTRAAQTIFRPVAGVGEQVVRVARALRGRAPPRSPRCARAPGGRRCRRRAPELAGDPGELRVELLLRPDLSGVHLHARELEVVEVEGRNAEPIQALLAGLLTLTVATVSLTHRAPGPGHWLRAGRPRRATSDAYAARHEQDVVALVRVGHRRMRVGAGAPAIARRSRPRSPPPASGRTGTRGCTGTGTRAWPRPGRIGSRAERSDWRCGAG